jgi:phosphoadenosine phosphosulfate reductase
MALWRPGGFTEETCTRLADDAPAPRDGAVIVSLPRWLAERETLAACGARVGVAVEAGADAQAHLVDLAARPLIALAFAKFGDGRAFSYARLLCDRYGFKGELRATGDVLIDEIPLMLRCGFTTFEVTNAPTIAALEAGRLPGLAIHYQPASVGGEARTGSRPWLRVDRSPA